MTTPNDLPSVGTEDARPQSLPERVADKISEGILTRNDGPLTQDELDRLGAASWLRTLVSKRDELASRVRELERAALAAQPGAEPAKNNDVDQLLRAVFELCEATEEAPEVAPKNEHQRGFERGRRFEAKAIRRAVGDWFQATFCGRSFMGEPVIAAAPTEAKPATQQASGEREAWKLEQILDERDEAQDMADQLADQIAAITGTEIGEHTSANDPWRNAMFSADQWIAEDLRRMFDGRQEQPRPPVAHRLRNAPSEIDYDLLIAACYGRTGQAQGTKGCVQFAKGAEWYREILAATPPPAPVLSDAWISVDERLPTPWEDVLIYPRPTDYCCEGQVDHKGQWTYSEYEMNFGNVTHKIKPTHWQPLPPPPIERAVLGRGGEQ